MKHFDFHADARAEFLETASYYDAEVPGLGERFIQELERCVANLLEVPQIGAPHGSKLRRFPLNRFPYSLIYRTHGDILFVVAVAHHSRKPGYWKNRVSD